MKLCEKCEMAQRKELFDGLREKHALKPNEVAVWFNIPLGELDEEQLRLVVRDLSAELKVWTGGSMVTRPKDTQ